MDTEITEIETHFLTPDNIVEAQAIGSIIVSNDRPLDAYSDRELLIHAVTLLTDLSKRVAAIEALKDELAPMLENMASSPMMSMLGKMFGRG